MFTKRAGFSAELGTIILRNFRREPDCSMNACALYDVRISSIASGTQEVNVS
jgi:hypothetical protein